MTSDTPKDQPGNTGLWRRKVIGLCAKLINASDNLIPESLTRKPDLERRARLLIRFGILGTFFGVSFAGFYFTIEHIYGAVLISIFTGVFALIPIALKRSGKLRQCSNLYILCVCLGFSGLTLIEGGMHGHAIAWLSVIPLCAMVLTNRKDANIWRAISMVLVGIFAYWHLVGIEFPELFPNKYASIVDAAGYAALVPFMIMIGFIFEATRKRAFCQLESAMDKLTNANEGLIKLNTEKNEFLNIAAHSTATDFNRLLTEDPSGLVLPN